MTNNHAVEDLQAAAGTCQCSKCGSSCQCETCQCVGCECPTCHHGS